MRLVEVVEYNSTRPEMIETARGLAEAPGSHWTDQLNNRDQLAGYTRMGEEIWDQTGGRVDAFVQSVGTSGSHRIEGVGAGFAVPLWTKTIADRIETVSTEEAMATARRLAREEAIFAGTSTGGNVAVALRVAERLGPDRTVVTAAIDSGMKYLSTGLYSEVAHP